MSAAGGLLTLCSAQSLLFPSLGDNIAHRNTLMARRRGRKGLAGKKQARRFIHPATSFLSDSQALSTLSKGQVGVVSGFSVAFTMLFPAFFSPNSSHYHCARTLLTVRQEYRILFIIPQSFQVS